MHYIALSLTEKCLLLLTKAQRFYETQLIDTIINDKYFSALEYIEQTKSNDLGIKQCFLAIL
jgi:hypothetical protein